ncbi:PWWP domain-containing protein MUM1-like isoform X1 [Arapaima gigas]
MEEGLYLCKWKGRQWPAKILRKVACNSRRKNNVEVEILGEKRVWVQERETLPLTKERIEDVALQLGQDAPEAKDPVEELNYRRVLRMAMNCFDMTNEPTLSIPASPRRSSRLNPSLLPASPSSARISRVKFKDQKNKTNDVKNPATCITWGREILLLQDSLSVHEQVSSRLRKRGQLAQSALSHLILQNGQQGSPPSSALPEKRTKNKRKPAGEPFPLKKMPREHCLLSQHDLLDPDSRMCQLDQGAKPVPKPIFTSMPNVDPHSLSSCSVDATSSSPKRKRQSDPQHFTLAAQESGGTTKESADGGNLNKMGREDAEDQISHVNFGNMKLPESDKDRQAPSRTSLRKDRHSAREMLVGKAGGSSIMSSSSPSTRSKTKNSIMLCNGLSRKSGRTRTPTKPVPKLTSTSELKVDPHSLSSCTSDPGTHSSPKRRKKQSDPQCSSVVAQENDGKSAKEGADEGDVHSLVGQDAKALMLPENLETVNSPVKVREKQHPTKKSPRKDKDSSRKNLLEETGGSKVMASRFIRSKNSPSSSDFSPCINISTLSKRRSRHLQEPFTSTPCRDPDVLSCSSSDCGTPQRKVVRMTRNLFRSSDLLKEPPSKAVSPKGKGRGQGRWGKAQSGRRDRCVTEAARMQNKGLCSPRSKACRRLNVHPEEPGSTDTERVKGNSVQTPSREAPESDCQELQTGETSLSSDLSIELSLHEDNLPLMSPWLQEESEEQEEEELPSILLQKEKKPLPIKEGAYVWCKFRNFPFWPAVVKSVNRKQKKASIFFIDDKLFDLKRPQKGFTVAWRTLKPFDCEERNQLKAAAKEKYGAAIKWCLELIEDYRIRIACGSFTGTFLEYFAADISCPVRRMYLQEASDLAFPSKIIMEEHSSLLESESEAGGLQRQSNHPAKRVLPDRSKAARNRANEKLVQFIVQKRGVEEHVQAIISGKVPSKRLKELMKSSREVELHKTYLEDEEQLEQVYRYLEDVYRKATQIAPCLSQLDEVRLIMDVLLPEAVVHAIAGVNKISLKNAEDKYFEGPLFSKRERDEFDMIIEQQAKEITQCPAS